MERLTGNGGRSPNGGREHARRGAEGTKEDVERASTDDLGEQAEVAKKTLKERFNGLKEKFPQEHRDAAREQYDKSIQFLKEEFPEERRDQFIYRMKKARFNLSVCERSVNSCLSRSLLNARNTPTIRRPSLGFSIQLRTTTVTGRHWDHTTPARLATTLLKILLSNVRVTSSARSWSVLRTGNPLTIFSTPLINSIPMHRMTKVSTSGSRSSMGTFVGYCWNLDLLLRQTLIPTQTVCAIQAAHSSRRSIGAIKMICSMRFRHGSSRGAMIR